MLKHANLTDQPWLEGLSEEQIDTLAELPKEERLRHYAEMHDKEPDEALTKLGDASGIQVLEDFEMVEEPTGRIPLRLINEFQCLPITNGQREGEDLEDPLYLDLVTVWPPEPMMDKWVFAQCGKTPRWRLGPPELIASTITQKFGVGADSLEDSHLDEFGFEEEEVDEEDENAAIIRFVNEVIHRAIAERATDIHFEPLRDDIQIRYRIDGELVPVRLPDNLVRVQDAIISRLKIMAKLNISEKRRPQDGRITFADGKTEMDIRVSTFPTMYAESVSLRLLNEKSQPLSVRELGLLEDDEGMFEIPTNDEAMQDDENNKQRDAKLEKELGSDESIDEELLGTPQKPQQHQAEAKKH